MPGELKDLHQLHHFHHDPDHELLKEHGGKEDIPVVIRVSPDQEAVADTEAVLQKCAFEP